MHHAINKNNYVINQLDFVVQLTEIPEKVGTTCRTRTIHCHCHYCYNNNNNNNNNKDITKSTPRETLAVSLTILFTLS